VAWLEVAPRNRFARRVATTRCCSTNRAACSAATTGACRTRTSAPTGRSGGARWNGFPVTSRSTGPPAGPGGISASDGTTTRPRHQLLQIVAGRVSDRVATVTYVGPEGTNTSVRPVRGTFLASIYLGSASPQTLRATRSGAGVVGVVRAYDAAGRLLAQRDPDWPVPCHTVPGSADVGYGTPRPGSADRKPAVRWRS
jgi:hypothetical protein